MSIRGGGSVPPRLGAEQAGPGRREDPLLPLVDPMLHYLGFLPVVDGDFLPDDPVNLFANAADIDYIAGTNNMDGHIFTSIDVPAIDKNKQSVTEYVGRRAQRAPWARGQRGRHSSEDGSAVEGPSEPSVGWGATPLPLALAGGSSAGSVSTGRTSSSWSAGSPSPRGSKGPRAPLTCTLHPGPKTRLRRPGRRPW